MKIAPIGGTILMLAWISLAIAAISLKKRLSNNFIDNHAKKYPIDKNIDYCHWNTNFSKF